MTLQIEDDLSALLRTGEQTEEAAARELIVLELYRQHRISSGKAAELLGANKTDFIHRASSLGIPYLDLTDDELRQEIEAAQSLAI
jgi:predicted HTH domain antitoxin